MVAQVVVVGQTVSEEEASRTMISWSRHTRAQVYEFFFANNGIPNDTLGRQRKERGKSAIVII